MQTNTVDTLRVVEGKLSGHDWYYHYSDDYSVVRRGERSWDALVALCKQVPVEQLRPLWRTYAPRDFQAMFEPLFCK